MSGAPSSGVVDTGLSAPFGSTGPMPGTSTGSAFSPSAAFFPAPSASSSAVDCFAQLTFRDAIFFMPSLSMAMTSITASPNASDTGIEACAPSSAPFFHGPPFTRAETRTAPSPHFATTFASRASIFAPSAGSRISTDGAAALTVTFTAFSSRLPLVSIARTVRRCKPGCNSVLPSKDRAAPPATFASPTPFASIASLASTMPAAPPTPRASPTPRAAPTPALPRRVHRPWSTRTSTRAMPLSSVACAWIFTTGSSIFAPSAGDWTESAGLTVSPSALNGARASLLSRSTSAIFLSGSMTTLRTTLPAGAGAVISTGMVTSLGGTSASAVRESSMSSPPALKRSATATCRAVPEPRFLSGTVTVSGEPLFGSPWTRISSDEMDRSGASRTRPGDERTAFSASACDFAAV